jgi:ubiquitin C-terminal hydrolase
LSFNTNNYLINKLELKDLLNNKYLYGHHKLIKLPRIFTITLLRAIINQPLIKTEVNIDEEIDLKDFLDKDFGAYSLTTIYNLYALNVCIGSSKDYGHYYSYILINNEWFKFDDLYVRKVQKNDIKEDLPYIYGIYYINKEYLNSLYC